MAPAPDVVRQWTLDEAHRAQVKAARAAIRKHIFVGRQQKTSEDAITTATGLPRAVVFAALVELVFDGVVCVDVDDSNIDVRRHYFVTSNGRLADEARW